MLSLFAPRLVYLAINGRAAGGAEWRPSTSDICTRRLVQPINMARMYVDAKLWYYEGISASHGNGGEIK